jgi:glycosyltransferase involved in cell wall biosynthesis
MVERELTLSVVVISWNQCAALQRLIAQLLDQDFPASQYEIIIVDDGSSDGTREWLKEPHESRIRVILGEANRGRAASRNVGIKAAQSGIVVMIDGDHTIASDFLSRHAERHNKKCCAVVGRSQFAPADGYCAINTYLNGGGAAKLPPHAPLPGRYFLTRNCSVPRDILKSIGNFDERFTSWGGEDLDLGVKLQESGVPIYGEPRALAWHQHWRPLRMLLTNMEAYGRNAIPVLLEKHPQLFAELNLDHILTWHGQSRYAFAHRFFMRVLLWSPVYWVARTTAEVFKNHRLPRCVFDYLHFRAYARGFLNYLQTGKDASFAC